MPDIARVERLEVRVGGLSRSQLLSKLSSRGILVNGHAETLLKDVVFDDQAARPVAVTERTVAELGLDCGATLPQIFEVARQQGLLLCPMDTGPYLRMALNEQVTSSDSVMSSGRAPDGALTVASEALSRDDDYPKGFYLRVVDGQAWLRGYRCDDEHTWSPDDRFIFQLPPLPA
ncbi:hypothetical protein JOE31_003916 [Arthrobacter sp. PvP023]|uniref:hypothetical protein n=1 Tax=Micrococcaceae TaxID=1268 RepID=UPI001AEA7899|nr:hypothetical protein [Arthrobacter sp. PvP023]MBP1137684.1 hypothetical protein [Arthrobacter sp. PvP023]